MKRRGVSILEVLFSILIVAIGLLGAVSVFTVAGSYSRKARVADDSNYAARKATADFDARGMRDVTTWYDWNGTAFQRLTPVQYTAAHLQSWCIDSRFAVANATDWANARTFPYNHVDNPAGPRMRRVAYLGVQPPGATLATQKLFADAVFWLEDDLAYLRPETDRSLPAEQQWAGGATPTKRQSEGYYSWMATLVPVVDAATALVPNLGTGNQFSVTSNKCRLSVVLFHQRPAGLLIDEYSERVVGLDDLGDSGGEFRIFASTAERLKIAPGQWIMLSGMSTATSPMGTSVSVPRFSWYRVSDAETPSLNGAIYESHVSLIGPDWDTSLNNKQAVILPGVVTVHEKTVSVTPPSLNPPELEWPSPGWSGTFGFLPNAIAR